MLNTWPGWENSGFVGEGSFGKVYKIKRKEFGTDYDAALKVITIPASQSDVKAAYDEGMDEESVTQYFHSFVEDIVAEFALMSTLKGNSNIVSYEDHMVVQHEDEVAWDILIRMELLTTLTDYAKKNPLNENDIIRLGIHMTRALELCRKRNIIHRDIKPENIFVSKDGDFKLGDFGVARVAEKTVSVMSRKGTYNYMAPEVYMGEEYSYTADIYSLGLVLYRFLNDNRVPFLPPYPTPIQYSDREKALNERMKGAKIPAPAYGSEEFKKIVLKACAFNPKDRYASATDMREDLEELARSKKLSASAQKKEVEEPAKPAPAPMKEPAKPAPAPMEEPPKPAPAPIEEPPKPAPAPIEEPTKPAIVPMEEPSKSVPAPTQTSAVNDVWWQKKWFAPCLFVGSLLLGTLLFAWDTFYDMEYYMSNAYYREGYDAFHHAFLVTFLVSAPLLLFCKCWNNLWDINRTKKKWTGVTACVLLLFLAFILYPNFGVVATTLEVFGGVFTTPVATIIGIVLMAGVWITAYKLRKSKSWKKPWMGLVLISLILLVEGVLIVSDIYLLEELVLESYLSANDTPFVILTSFLPVLFFGTILLAEGYIWSGETKRSKLLWKIAVVVTVVLGLVPIAALAQIIMNVISLPIQAVIGVALGVGALVGVNKLIQKKIQKK